MKKVETGDSLFINFKGLIWKSPNKHLFDLVNVNSCAFGTITLFFWVAFKLSESTKKRDYNKLIVFSLSTVFLFYLSYAIVGSLNVDSMPDVQSYLLYQTIQPSFTDLNTVIILINLVNQIFQANFYFLVIKTMILKEKVANLIKNPVYYTVVTPIYLAIIAFAAHELVQTPCTPYMLILTLNGGAGFIMHILIPGKNKII